MRIGRALVIPSILALGIAGSALVAPTVTIGAMHVHGHPAAVISVADPAPNGGDGGTGVSTGTNMYHHA